MSHLVSNQTRDQVEDNGWIYEVINGDNSMFYFNTDTFSGHWAPPSDDALNNGQVPYYTRLIYFISSKNKNM